ncbi:hypothetical protein OEZ85_000426 [Tetradesmus obliquus]|uniref:Uncharacterized protein n=1 Tax=Tetradesmus obliquus TaxID=3088 RepID=A0ABY8UW42_TETOB|nr:hypothetical protein OEZ85_000426 [Tetradesmus obliquus]
MPGTSSPAPQNSFSPGLLRQPACSHPCSGSSSTHPPPPQISRSCRAACCGYDTLQLLRKATCRHCPAHARCLKLCCLAGVECDCCCLHVPGVLPQGHLLGLASTSQQQQCAALQPCAADSTCKALAALTCSRFLAHQLPRLYHLATAADWRHGLGQLLHHPLPSRPKDAGHARCFNLPVHGRFLAGWERVQHPAGNLLAATP